LRAVDGSSDRPRPGPQRCGHDLDLVERRRVNASSQLVADAAQEQVRGGRDTAADHDPVRGDYRNHTGSPDPELASNVGQPFNPPTSPARARATASSAVAGPHATAVGSA